MVHELRALHSVCGVGGLVRIVSEGCACGSRGGHLCVVDIKNISGTYEGVDKGSRGRGTATPGVVEGG